MFVVDMEPVQHQIHVYVMQIMLEQIVNWLFVSERMKVTAMCAMVTALVPLQILAVAHLDTTALIAAAMIVTVFCLATVQFVLVMEIAQHLPLVVVLPVTQGLYVNIQFVTLLVLLRHLFAAVMERARLQIIVVVLPTMLGLSVNIPFAMEPMLATRWSALDMERA